MPVAEGVSTACGSGDKLSGTPEVRGSLSTREQQPLKINGAGWEEARPSLRGVCCLGFRKVGTISLRRAAGGGDVRERWWMGAGFR